MRMFNINRYLTRYIGREIIVKLKVGEIRCVLDWVTRDGTLKVSQVKIISSRDKLLSNWEGKDNIVIRKDSIVAIFMEES